MREKLQNIQEPGVILNEMVNAATSVFYNQDQEMKVKDQEKEGRKETGYAQILAAIYGQTQSKGTLLSTRRTQLSFPSATNVDKWAKEYPIKEKPPKSAWIVLSKGFKDNLHALGQVLEHDL